MRTPLRIEVGDPRKQQEVPCPLQGEDFGPRRVAAALAGDRAEIDELVAGGANPNAREAGSCAPLHYAASNNPAGEVAAALFGNGDLLARPDQTTSA